MNTQTSKSQLLSLQIKTLNLIFFALALGQLLFFAVTYFIHQTEQEGNEMLPNLQAILQYMAPLALAAGVVGGSFVYMFFINKANNPDSNATLETKLTTYRTANIMRWALLEGGNMVALVGYFLTKNMLYAYLFMVGYLVFLSNRPSTDKFANQFNLTDSEKWQLES